MKLTSTGCAVLLCGLFTVSSAHAQEPRAAAKHEYNLDDRDATRSASTIAISPDGKTVLYQVSFNGAKGPIKHEWHVINTSGDGDRKLTLPEHFRPTGFMNDGESLYGTYPVGQQAAIGIVPLDPTKPTRILSLPSAINSITLSPDGAHFALLADPRKKDPLEGVHNVIENDQTSLYVIGTDGSNGAWWCASLNEIGDVAWSPDSSQLAVMSSLPKIGHHDVRTFIDICSGAGARRVADIPNAAGSIAWTNGGRDLAFVSTTTLVLTPEHLWTVSVSGGAPVDRTPQLAGTIQAVESDRGGKLWVQLDKGVRDEIDEYLDGKLELRYRWPDGVASLPAFPAGASSPDVFAINVNDPQHAGNVAVVRDGQPVKITHEGDDVLANVELGEVRVVNWTAKDGTKLEGIATFPSNFSAGQKSKFLVLPHGGPESNDTLRFDQFARFLAGMGYVVLQPEYRGSTGYGSDFLAAIYQHFGDRAYSDVDSATDFAIAQGWADPNKLAIFGWSAGGFMTSWTVTQTHRYKAAIEGAGITDWLSFIPTSDISQVDYDARMQEKDPAPLLQFSAVMHADQVTTPLLILHGESDQRVPTFQGREYYMLLAERGKTVRMVTYPGSPHFPIVAEQQRDVFQEIADWLAKYNP